MTKKIVKKPTSFEELLNIKSDEEELEEFRLEMKQKLALKLEQEDKKLKQ